MTNPRSILLVDDSPTQLAHMKMVLAGTEFSVLTAEGGQQAMDLVRSDSPDLVVTDLEMPEMSGLELVMMLKFELPALPVILTTSRGSEELAVEALQNGAASYVPKRNLAKELSSTIERTLSVADSEKQRLNFSQFVSKIYVELELCNDDAYLPQILARLESPLVELGICSEANSTNIGVALDEALRNSMIHGNLEVSSDLREAEGDAYMNQIRERLQDPKFANRRVRVRLEANHEEATITVTDEGPGFDVSSLPDPTDPENWEEVSGRGLLLMRAFMDEVRYNDKGNELTLVKKRQDADAADDDED